MKMRLASPFSSLIFALAVASWFPGESAHADAYVPEYTQGNGFYFSSSGSTTVSTTAGFYNRFTATETTTATSVSLNLNSATATSLTFGLQADDGTGKPTGTFLASGTVTPVAGWNTVTFAGYELTAGQVYHVVALPTASGNALARHLSGIPTMNFQSYGVRDAAYIRGLTNASGVPTGTPGNTVAMVYAVGTTSHGIGQAFSVSANNTLSATAPLAQRFQFTPSASNQTVLDTITVRLNTGAADLKDVTISILNDNNIVLATTTLAKSALTASTTADYTVDFGDSLVLTEGAYYKLALHSGEAGTTSVKWNVSKSNSTNSAINSATFQGTDGYAFAYSNTSFTTPQGFAYGDDYTFHYTTIAIPEPGVGAAVLLGLGVIGSALRRKILA